MSPTNTRYRSGVATAVFDLLDPIPYGFFVAALIFDVAYARGGNVLWNKGAAWLITIGLFFAIIPRLVNLAQVWLGGARRAAFPEKLDFWLNLLGIVAAIVNAFVHSRDAYGAVPDSVILSIFTVALLGIGHVLLAFHKAGFKEPVHE